MNKNTIHAAIATLPDSDEKRDLRSQLQFADEHDEKALSDLYAKVRSAMKSAKVHQTK